MAPCKMLKEQLWKPSLDGVVGNHWGFLPMGSVCRGYGGENRKGEIFRGECGGVWSLTGRLFGNCIDLHEGNSSKQQQPPPVSRWG